MRKSTIFELVFTRPYFNSAVVASALRSRFVISTFWLSASPQVLKKTVFERVASVSLAVNLKFGNLEVSNVTFTFTCPAGPLAIVSASFTADDKSTPANLSAFSLNDILSVGTEIAAPVYW